MRDVAVAGSYRRRKDTVGDLDILVTCEHGLPVIEHFVGYKEVAKKSLPGATEIDHHPEGRYPGQPSRCP